MKKASAASSLSDLSTIVSIHYESVHHRDNGGLQWLWNWDWVADLCLRLPGVQTTQPTREVKQCRFGVGQASQTVGQYQYYYHIRGCSALITPIWPCACEYNNTGIKWKSEVSNYIWYLLVKGVSNRCRVKCHVVRCVARVQVYSSDQATCRDQAIRCVGAARLHACVGYTPWTRARPIVASKLLFSVDRHLSLVAAAY